MERRASSIIWLIVGFIGLVVVGAAAIFGPRLYREGKALLAPIAAIDQAEDAIRSLDTELGFTPPADNLVDEQRLQVMLAIWDELRPLYVQWETTVNSIEQDPEGAKLQAAKQVLGETSAVIGRQVAVLREHGMAPAELCWLEDHVLDGWWLQLDPLVEDRSRPAVLKELRRVYEEELQYLGGLKRQHPGSPVIPDLQQRFQDRLSELTSTSAPVVADVPEQNLELFWRYRDRIAAIADRDRFDLHRTLRGDNDLVIHADQDGTRIELQPDAG